MRFDSEEEEDEEMEEVAEAIEDDAVALFDGHEKAVFCVSLHPGGGTCVSGGEDDRANLWDALTGERTREFTEHEDSVVVAGFSFDGAYLATADMAGRVVVRRETDGGWTTAWETHAGDLSWGFWHPAAHVLVCGAQDGQVYVWKMPDGRTKVLQTHGAQTSAGSLLRDGKRLAVGYDDGSLKVWDLKTGAVACHSAPPDRETASPVNAVDADHPTLVAVGHADGRLSVVKSDSGKAVGGLKLESTVEAVKFSRDPSLALLAIATLEGTVGVWDVARQTLRHRCASAEDEGSCGVTRLLWVGRHLVCGRLDGSVRVYDGKSGETTRTLAGHGAEILDMAYSSATDTLVTASEDGTCRTFKAELNK